MDDPCSVLSQQLGELFQCSANGDLVRVRTPYLYPDGDYIDLFVGSANGTTTISDLGETARWLRMQTISPRRSPKQRQMIEDICLTHGVEFFKGALLARYRNGESFAACFMRVAQASLRVADLWFTFRTRAFESISDEVADVLREREINFDRGETLIGRSGRSYTIDFHTRTPQRSALVSVLSTGSRPATRRIVEHTFATWSDLNQLKIGPEAVRFLSLFDDSVDVWAAEDFRLVEEVSIVTRWSAPEEFVAALVSHA